ncbi:MAG: hypothetical protein PHD05_00715 [Sphaerochaetaceae bacterium]|nr:hypothetical protein [Sphaerochaetaceae bacterium]
MLLTDDDFKKRTPGIYDKVEFQIVDTNKFRLEDIAFTMGGHHYVYPKLISENLICLDNCMDKDNVIATSIHEFVERLFMKFYGIQYEDAHSLSNSVEIIIRAFIEYDLPHLKKEFKKGR